MYRLGIDLGGTNIAAAVVDENYKIVGRGKVKTALPRPAEEICDAMAEAAKAAIADAGLKIEDIAAMGVGTPGAVDPSKGIVTFANNLGFMNTPICAMMKERLGVDFYLENDANAAAYGEFLAGAGKGTKNFVAVTLGTGVGGGIVIDGKLFSGAHYAGGELGHTVINVDGEQCSCGRKGCWEQYASVSALMDMAKKAATASPDSLLGRLYTEKSTMSGEVFFEAYEQKCPKASAVFDEYITWLAEGINTLISIFAPDMIVISGGISAVGTVLTKPLSDKVSAQIPIKTSILQNDAGIIGAASL